MSVHGPDAGRGKPWRAAWRDGRQRTMRFATEHEAIAFDALPTAAKSALADGPATPTPVAPAEPVVELDGVYPYPTQAGTRYRFNSNGTGRRGFTTPEEALLEKGRFEEKHSRGEVAVGRVRFEDAWQRYLTYKAPRFPSPGSYENLERDGRLHILPFFTGKQLHAIDATVVEAWMATLKVDAPTAAPKTINNWRAQLSGFFNWCRSRPDLPVVANPCEFVETLPVEAEEMAFLTLLQIPGYYDCCSPVYRPLAKFLVATGVRVSEAVAMRIADVDLEARVVRVYRQRDRTPGEVATRQTKGKKFRTIPIPDDLVEALRDMLALRAEHEKADDGWLFLCPPPKRGRYAHRTTPVPPHRKTVNDWHETALAALNARSTGVDIDVTLHGLRHTAAAAWLSTGKPLYHVQKLLGHRSAETTERYAHLELDPLRSAAKIETARLQAIAAGLLV